MIEAAPAVITKKRTLVCDLERTILEAAHAACGSPILTPVHAPGLGRVAYVRGKRGRTDVDVWPLSEKMWAGFASYDDLISRMTAGNKFSAFFGKAHTSAPVANTWYDLWPVTGAPTAGTYGGTAYTATQYSDASTGALLHGGNVSTSTKHLISQVTSSSGGTPTLWLCDRVLTYEACSFNANVNQAMTNSVSAARYVGSAFSGMQVMVVAQTVLGATASNMTLLTYSNQAGGTGRTMPTAVTKAISVSAAAPATSLGARCVMPLGTSPWMELQAGDVGVSLISNFTTSAANTGTLAFLMLRPLAMMPTYAAGIPATMDLVAQVASLERVYDGACLCFVAFFPAATASTILGKVDVAWG